MTQGKGKSLVKIMTDVTYKSWLTQYTKVDWYYKSVHSLNKLHKWLVIRFPQRATYQHIHCPLCFPQVNTSLKFTVPSAVYHNKSHRLYVMCVTTPLIFISRRLSQHTLWVCFHHVSSIYIIMYHLCNQLTKWTRARMSKFWFKWIKTGTI